MSEQEAKSALACSFCGRISMEHEGWRQLFDRSMTSHDDEDTYMMCPKCHEKLIADNIGAVIDPEAPFEAVREAIEDGDPAKDYIGIPLRDFLQSRLYMQMHEAYFADRYGIRMKNYLECMDARILRIDERDPLGRRRVILDTESD